MSTSQANSPASAPTPEPLSMSPETSARALALLGEHQRAIWCRTDRLFAGLLACEWIGAIIWAVIRTPWTWDGSTRSVHPHVWQAIILGALTVVAPIFLVLRRPGAVLTRQVVGISQMLISALLIHVSGGRIETHFHVFGSLAFLAFYRDWRVLISASAVVAADHLVRNYMAPESVYGVLTAGTWRWLEHALWVVFEDIFLIASCRQSVSEMRGIAQQRALLEHSYQLVEDKVKQRTAQLREAQSDLLRVARSAGMAEIATSVLHNVGNVLNSVNVSLRVATGKVEKSPVKDLSRAIGMIREHREDLAGYLTRDERGKQIPEFLEAVSEVLSCDQAQMLEEMNSLARNVDHIKEIVSVQQSHAKVSGLVEQVRIADLLEDAIKVTMVTSNQLLIGIERHFDGLPPVNTDKHALLQILINLMSNAKHAIVNNGKEEKKLTIRGTTFQGEDADWLRIEVIDNGVGIEPANLTRIFNHGFTTKKDGHGFGLHSSANSAKTLGGRLAADSEGLGKGASFILELPIRKEAVGT